MDPDSTIDSNLIEDAFPVSCSLKHQLKHTDKYPTTAVGATMSDREVHELPVPILTDDELLAEYAHTFDRVLANNLPESDLPADIDSDLRRNSAAMGELLRRGYRSASLHWHRPETS